MTATHAPNTAPGYLAHPAQDDSTGLGDYLSPRCFPASRDELQATLVRRHAPARLLWELSALSPNRRYGDLDEVTTALERPAVPALPGEPF